MNVPTLVKVTDPWGWPIGISRVQRVAVASSVFPDSAVRELLQRAFVLGGGGTRDELITGLSLRMIQSGCRLPDGGSVRWMEIDWDCGGLRPTRMRTAGDVDVTADRVDGEVSTWVRNIHNPSLARPVEPSPQGPFLIDLHQFCHPALAECWGPRGVAGQVDREQMRYLINEVVQATFLGAPGAPAGAQQRSDAKTLVEPLLPRLDSDTVETGTCLALRTMVRRAIRRFPLW